MSFVEDFYFFSGGSIRNACKNHSSGSIQMNSSARALFHSLALRKKFNKTSCFVTDVVLKNILEDKDHGEVFKNNFILHESLREEESKNTYDGLGIIEMEIASTLSQATVKAGDCEGKVKVVFPNEAVDQVNRIISALELPLSAINEKQAEEEIVSIHNELYDIRISS